MTLYISTVDLQIFCGAKRLLGRLISSRDYERSIRRILSWKSSRAARLTTLHAIELLNETYSEGRSYRVRGDQTLHYGYCMFIAILIIWSYDTRRHQDHHLTGTLEGTEYLNEIRSALLSNSQVPKENNVCADGLIQTVADSLSGGRWDIIIENRRLIVGLRTLTHPQKIKPEE
ncbi:Zinc finger protein klf1 [Neolecta irregularis DAH-3]|uniref:Zinc finger protein klf1 n=1 Tax=Neolecta irregularis (strain DAH-3) TaxID=1198029 RepID=A0A1U7LMU5_NEOID|nr:Zinc finger protein klf1 [Neolecta irregularis DAH-3]|eukprot:OLL23990.1 Zinc finger protein klf1 [Neolecta irregularis DAH-3]